MHLKVHEIFFQNIDAIKYLTIPNVLLNKNSLENCKFYFGDWGHFNKLLTKNCYENKFDYIFTSETIYNTECYPKLHTIFKDVLKKTGIMYPFKNEIFCFTFKENLNFNPDF